MRKVPLFPLVLVGALLVSLLNTLGMTRAPVELVAASHSFPNSAIADAGIAEAEKGTVNPTGWNQPGECIKSAARWVAAAGGSMGGGGPVSTYTNSGAQEVSLQDAQPGDIIQYTSSGPDADTNWDHVHTVVVVQNYGNGHFDIVQSNANWDGKVTRNQDWAPNPYPGWTARVWRFGTVPSTQPQSAQNSDNNSGGTGSTPQTVTTPNFVCLGGSVCNPSGNSSPNDSNPQNFPTTPVCAPGQDLVGGQCVPKQTGCEAVGYYCSNSQEVCRSDQVRGRDGHCYNNPNKCDHNEYWDHGHCRPNPECDHNQVSDGHGGCKDKPTGQNECRHDQVRGHDGKCYDTQKECPHGQVRGAHGQCSDMPNNGNQGSDGNDSCPNGMVRIAPETDNTSGCAPAGNKQEGDPQKQEQKQKDCPVGQDRLGGDGACHGKPQKEKQGSSSNDSCPNGMVRISPETEPSAGAHLQAASNRSRRSKSKSRTTRISSSTSKTTHTSRSITKNPSKRRRRSPSRRTSTRKLRRRSTMKNPTQARTLTRRSAIRIRSSARSGRPSDVDRGRARVHNDGKQKLVELGQQHLTRVAFYAQMIHSREKPPTAVALKRVKDNGHKHTGNGGAIPRRKYLFPS